MPGRVRVAHVGEWDAKADDQDRAVEIHGFQRLEDGATMVVETSGEGYDCRLLEIEADGTIRVEFSLVTRERNTHADTRNATKTKAGTYLVAHENDGAVREYSADGSGEVIWEFYVPLFGKERDNGIDGHGPTAFGAKMPTHRVMHRIWIFQFQLWLFLGMTHGGGCGVGNKCFSAIRLEDGNTLIGGGNGHCVLEVTPEQEIVWSIFQYDLSGIVLAWVTQVKRKPNGNTLIVNCHAGPDNPHIIEVNRAKEVVWTWCESKLIQSTVLRVQSMRDRTCALTAMLCIAMPWPVNLLRSDRKDWETFGDAMPVAVVFDS